MATVRLLAERDHEFPPTWRAMTGGGGEHVIFACPEGIIVNSSSAASNPLLGAGIDIRAKDGYIVAVPCRHVGPRLCLVRRPPSRRDSDRRGAGVADRGAARPRARQRRPAAAVSEMASEGRSRSPNMTTSPAPASPATWSVSRSRRRARHPVLVERTRLPAAARSRVHRVWRRIVHRHAERINAGEARHA